MTFATASALLAQSDSEQKVLVDRDKLEAVSQHINDGIQHDMPWELLLAGIGAMMMMVVVISLRRWWLGRHADPTPMVLFSAIARKAGLGWHDRYLLWRISRTFDLPTPITLMLSKGTLRHYSDLYLNSHSPGTNRRNGQRLSRIEHLLFE